MLPVDHGDMQLEHQMFYKVCLSLHSFWRLDCACYWVILVSLSAMPQMVPYDASARVPLVIASAAGLPQAGSVVNQPVQARHVWRCALVALEHCGGAPLSPARFSCLTFSLRS